MLLNKETGHIVHRDQDRLTTDRTGDVPQTLNAGFREGTAAGRPREGASTVAGHRGRRPTIIVERVYVDAQSTKAAEDAERTMVVQIPDEHEDHHGN